MNKIFSTLAGSGLIVGSVITACKIAGPASPEFPHLPPQAICLIPLFMGISMVDKAFRDASHTEEHVPSAP